jgi:hypothetical protein
VTVEQYTVEYSLNYSTWTAISNVQEITARVGRTGLQDTFEPSGASIVIRYPSGFASPIAAFNVGTWIRIKRVGAIYETWNGKIRNVTVQWGKPYNYGTATGNADYVTLECEGALAEWGRLQGNNASVVTANAYFQLADVSFQGTLPVGTTYSPTTSPTVGASTISGSYAEWLNTFAATLGATIKDGSNQVGVYTKDFVGTLPVSFSDAANNATNQVYDELTFDSLAADYYTRVEVNTLNFGTVVVTAAGATAPFRTLRISTFSASVGQATDLANYYLGIYSTPSFGISSLSCKAEAQNTFALELGYAWWDLPGYRCNITFRGNTYYMTILGCTLTATPESARYSYSVIDADLNPYLILDDPVYGVLNTNKLSW